MDNSFLKEQAARCRGFAVNADEFTKRRLLDLAARYDDRVLNQPSRASRINNLPVNPAPHADPGIAADRAGWREPALATPSGRLTARDRPPHKI
jgi:hypothetical protein